MSNQSIETTHQKWFSINFNSDLAPKATSIPVVVFTRGLSGRGVAFLCGLGRFTQRKQMVMKSQHLSAKILICTSKIEPGMSIDAGRIRASGGHANATRGGKKGEGKWLLFHPQKNDWPETKNNFLLIYGLLNCRIEINGSKWFSLSWGIRRVWL